MKLRQLSLFAAAGLIGAGTFFVPQAKAGEWDRLTRVTFNQPFEIPGMVLPPGTYTMKLTDTPFRGPEFVIFSDATDQHTYRIVQAIPVYRDESTDHTVITFEERAGDSPQAIKDWYYPGSLMGEELMYPKARLTASVAPPPTLALATPPAPPAQAAAPAPEPQAEVTQQTNTESAQVEQQAPVETAQAQPAPAPEQSNDNTQPQSNDNNQNTQLPKTGSELPLIGLLGLISTGSGLILRKSS